LSLAEIKLQFLWFDSYHPISILELIFRLNDQKWSLLLLDRQRCCSAGVPTEAGSNRNLTCTRP